ncbi:MAG: hypothetical protein K0S61_689 [Anaerocolumna sp.]|jgi:hypothetical protein|nr:hypothetical protein [Anaerocolumna sp.]
MFDVKAYAKSKAQAEKMTYYQNDTKASKIFFEINQDSGTPMEGIVSAAVTLQNPNDEEDTTTWGMDYIDIEDNLVTFTLPNWGLTEEGTYNGQIKVYGTDEQRLTMTNFKYKVTAEIPSGVSSTDSDIPILTGLINDTNEVMNRHETNYEEALALSATNANLEIVDARKGKTNLGLKIDEIDSSLEDISYNVSSFGAVGNGITDDTIAIQNTITEAGTGKKIIFEKGKTYKVSSTIFVPVGVILEFNYCTITPVSGGTFTNGFVFSCNSSNVSTWDEQYPYKFVEFRHLVSDNVNLINNLKLIFAACPLRTVDVYSRRYYQTIKTGSLYIDLFDINFVMVVDHMSSTNYSIEKVGQGDSVTFKGIHCVNYLSGAYLKGVSISGSLGCKIEGCLNGDYKINNCESISFDNCHFEKGNILLQDSNGEINNSYFWKKPNESCITLVDSQLQYSGQINRPFTLNNVVFKLKYQVYSYSSDYDEIDISSYAGELILNNVFRECESYGAPYAYAYNSGITLKTGSGTNILSNSNNLTIRNKIVKNDKIINGANDDGYYYLSNIGTYESANIDFKASLTTYYYRIASILDKGRMIGVINNSGEKSIAVTNAHSYVKFIFGSSAIFLPMIRIYRGTSTGVYDKYVDIPYTMSRSLFDTGEDVNGFAWKTNVSNTVDTLNTSYAFEMHGTNIVSYGTGIPTIGTWLRGDRIINMNPSASGYEGWICTVAGTPGTWKGFGVIQS